MSLLQTILASLSVVGLVYFALYDGVYLLMGIIGYRGADNYVRRRPAREYEVVERSSLSPGITVLVPAHNEQGTIVSSVRALLATRYAQLRVLVIDDGSSDDTLQRLTESFRLVPIDRVPRAELPHAPVHGHYRSADEPRLSVVSKVGGGKADGLNAGISHVATPLFCTIDADTLLNPGALARLVWEFEAQPRTVAVGGIVRVLNGCTVEQGQLSRIRTSGHLLADIQTLEYLRAFLGGRIAWSRLKMLLIISGAFGLFRTDAVLEVGGYDAGTIGEDAELVLRLHRKSFDGRRGWNITFVPDPICWTEAPENLSILIRQRDRWQRGLIEMLLKHRAMMLRPRYRQVGLVAMPYFAVFEAFGPVFELLSGILVVAALLVGAISVPLVLLFLALAILVGFVLSFLALLIEERAYDRYPRWSDLRTLLRASVVENVGYRQLMMFVRARAWITSVTRRGKWGEMVRIGIGEQQEEIEPAQPNPAAEDQGDIPKLQ